MNFGDQRLPDKFWEKVIPDPMGGCWLFVSAQTCGYGVISHEGAISYAHRLAYEKLVGAIPNGLTIDHRCRVRCCCNPSHLEPITKAENTRRGLRGRLTTHCAAGHLYDEGNTRITSKGRRSRRTCRACSRLRHVTEARARKEERHRRNEQP